MSNLIFKTQRQAIRAAKNDCIAQAEATFSLSLKTSTCKKLKYDSKNWIQRSYTGSCVCGETPAIREIFFYRGEQFECGYAYCNYCGSENPMP